LSKPYCKQRLAESVLTEFSIKKVPEGFYPIQKCEEMSAFVETYREKFRRENRHLDQVVPHVKSQVEEAEKKVLLNEESISEAKSSLLWKLWESSKVPTVEAVHPDATRFDFILSEDPLASAEETEERKKFYGIYSASSSQITRSEECFTAPLAVPSSPARQKIVLAPPVDKIQSHETSLADTSTMSAFDPILSSSRVDVTANAVPSTVEKLRERLSQIVEEESGMWGTPLTPSISVRGKLDTPLSTPQQLPTPVTQIKTDKTPAPIRALSDFQTPLALKTRFKLDGEVGISDCSPMHFLDSPPASTENVLRSSSSQQQNIAAKFQLSPSFYESGQEKGSKIPDLKEIPAFEDEDELLFGAGSLGSVQQPKKSGKDSRKSAVIRKRLSELTRTIGQQSMEGETDLGDKENQMSLLMNEPEDLLQDMSLTEN